MLNREGRFYRLDNTYLSQQQKLDTELWFQWPGNVMQYVFFIMAILSVLYQVPLSYVLGISIAANLIAGAINWNFYSITLLRVLGFSLTNNYATAIVGVSVAIYLALKGFLLLAGISVLVGAVGFLFLEMHIFLYSFLAQKYNMDAKYVFAKRRFGLVFPFENSAH